MVAKDFFFLGFNYVIMHYDIIDNVEKCDSHTDTRPCYF